MDVTNTLRNLGWRQHFELQLAEPGDAVAARVTRVHRDRVEMISTDGECAAQLTHQSAAMGLTVGDWVLLGDDNSVQRRLEPFALFKRRAAGAAGDIQTIAANVDTVFIVTSANRDFNVARLERYLAIAHDAGTFPVVVISKADLADDAEQFRQQASRLSPGLLVEVLDARDPQAVAVLQPWCEAGQTVALLGSSGVGKSTLINSLAGTEQSTQAARDDDQRGRHTTTSRSMHKLQNGGWLIDTPGMRELQLVDVGDALDDVFAEVAELAAQCRFIDCEHNSEPGCAIQAAIQGGALDAGRLKRYRKLLAEDQRNSESIAMRRSRDRGLSKMYKAVQSVKRAEKGGRK